MSPPFDFRGALRREIGSILLLSEAQLDQLEHHFQLLDRWNRRMNLTSIREPLEIVRRHFCESVFLAAHLPPNIARLADIGSGAGFPGLPVAIMRPQVQVTLVESNRRKSVFLSEAARELPNVRVLAVRSSEVLGTFDALTIRAVSLESVLKDAARLANRLEILTTAGAAELFSHVPHFQVERQIPLPWGEQRVLLSVVLRST